MGDQKMLSTTIFVFPVWLWACSVGVRGAGDDAGGAVPGAPGGEDPPRSRRCGSGEHAQVVSDHLSRWGGDLGTTRLLPDVRSAQQRSTWNIGRAANVSLPGGATGRPAQGQRAHERDAGDRADAAERARRAVSRVRNSRTCPSVSRRRR
jgi:hypothetical protein